MTTKLEWVPRRPRAPAARRAAAAGYTPVRCSSSPDDVPPPPIRRSANYRPNSWNYGYMESLAAANNNKQSDRSRTAGDPSSFDKLKFRVRHLLLQKEVELLPKLRVIDTVQRLGIAYHFDEEISAILNSVSMERQDVDRMDDVRLMTLSFRLLRQNNYPVSPAIGAKATQGDLSSIAHSVELPTPLINPEVRIVLSTSTPDVSISDALETREAIRHGLVLWKERNRRTFDRLHMTTTQLLEAVEEEAEDWCASGFRRLAPLLAAAA